MPFWDEIEAQATVDSWRSLFFSPTSYWLLVAALETINTRRGWGKPDDATWDEIEAALAQAALEMSRGGMLGQVVYMATLALPDNMLLCDGSSHNRVDYPDLYAALHSAFIDDADTFHTPNLIGVFARGSIVSNIGSTGGEAAHTLTVAEMPTHTHGYTVVVPNVDLESPGAPDAFAGGVGPVVNTGSAGGGGSHNNLPPYMELMPCLIAR